MRAAAKVEPLPLLVDLEVLALGDRIHQLDLEQLALFLEEVLGLLAAPELLGEGGVAIDDLAHLGFDPGHVVGVERLLLVEVVEVPVLDHRADGHLRAGPQRLHGFRHDVRGIVTDQLQRLRIGAGDELDRDVLVDGVGEVRKPAVHHHRHGPLGQRLGDALGQRLAGDPTGVGPLGTIGKCQGDVAHFLLLSLAANQAGKVEVHMGPIHQAPSGPACALAHAAMSSRRRAHGSAALRSFPQYRRKSACTCEARKSGTHRTRTADAASAPAVRSGIVGQREERPAVSTRDFVSPLLSRASLLRPHEQRLALFARARSIREKICCVEWRRERCVLG